LINKTPGTIIACNLNALGSWHDSHVAMPIYEKLIKYTPDGYYLVTDTAFPVGEDDWEEKSRHLSSRIKGYWTMRRKEMTSSTIIDNSFHIARWLNGECRHYKAHLVGSTYPYQSATHPIEPVFLKWSHIFTTCAPELWVSIKYGQCICRCGVMMKIFYLLHGTWHFQT
jgi:hypothetical protein